MAQSSRGFPKPQQELSELYDELGSLARDAKPTRNRGGGRRRPPFVPSLRTAIFIVGFLLIAAGIWVIVAPLVGVWQRGRVDDSALAQWKNGGSQAVAGGVSAPDAVDHPQTCGVQAPSQDAYALMTFPSLAQYGYSGVAGDGTWDLLHQRSVVHYQGSPAPGQQGNVIIAFHRESKFEHIDQLDKGMEVDLQDRSCKVYHYTVTEKWVGPPDKVSQLVQTSGHDLTLVTCTPWYQDYDRIVWRATLAG